MLVRQRYPQAVAVLIAAAVLALYARTAGFEYVFDDNGFIVGNPGLAKGLTAEGVRWAFGSFSYANWHPVTWLAHLADRALFGPGAGPAHLVNASLHAACSMLLFLLLRRMTGALWASGFAVAVFALHPLRVESVAWVTERKDPLSTIFWLFGTWAYLGYARRPGAARYTLVVVCFAISLMTKPSVVTFPLALLLLDVWPLGRLRGAGSPALPGLARDASRLLAEKVPLLAMSAGASLVTVAAQGAFGAVTGLDAYPMPVRVANALTAAFSNLERTFWPRGLAVYYPHPGPRVPAWDVVLAGTLLLAATVLALRSVSHRPALAVGWLWYLGTLVPTSGLVQVGGQATADRFTYLPSVGLSIAVTWGTTQVLGGYRLRPKILTSVAVAALLAMGASSWMQIGYWRDNITLYRHALAVTRDNWLILNNYGTLVLDDDLAAAISYFQESARIRPGFAEAHMNLGASLEKAAARNLAVPGVANLLAEAESQYRLALALNPGFADAMLSLSSLFVREGRDAEAIAVLTDLSRLHPELPMAQMNLAILLARGGRFDEAIARHHASIELDSVSAEAHFNLGVTLEAAGRSAAAQAEYREALRLDPKHPRARTALERLEHTVTRSKP